MSLTLFVTATFALSLIAFTGIALIPGAQSPETARGFPVWLLAVWSPSLIAFAMVWWGGDLGGFLSRALSFGGVHPVLWPLALSPLIGAALWVMIAGNKADPMTVGFVLKLLAFNLILGPLGEEFGWRGVLQPGLEAQIHWIIAALVTGVIWGAWHLPLWLVPSPQSEIPIWVFMTHCLAYAIIMAAMGQLAAGSLIPAILFHLMVNAGAGLVIIAGIGSAATVYRALLLPYGLLAVVSVAIALTVSHA